MARLKTLDANFLNGNGFYRFKIDDLRAAVVARRRSADLCREHTRGRTRPRPRFELHAAGHPKHLLCVVVRHAAETRLNWPVPK
jgi:hypothetical protein